MLNVPAVLISGAVGAALAYLLDPDRGAARRARLRDQAGASARRAADDAERALRQLRDQAHGVLADLRPPNAARPADDLTVLSRVETALFGMPGFPRGQVDVEVREGQVVLRGEVSSEREAHEIVEAAGRVHGVYGVESLLHLPGEPAPNKAAARRSGA